MRAIIADPAFRARVVGVGTAPRTGTPEEFAAAIEEQRAKIAAIHQASDTKPRAVSVALGAGRIASVRAILTEVGRNAMRAR